MPMEKQKSTANLKYVDTISNRLGEMFPYLYIWLFWFRPPDEYWTLLLKASIWQEGQAS